MNREVLNRIVNNHMDRVGRKVQSDAKNNAPVNTGALRNSIFLKRDGIDGTSRLIGSDIKYARYLELGTRFIAPIAFLRRALRNITNYRG